MTLSLQSTTDQLNLLPLMMEYDLLDIMFLVKLKMENSNVDFCSGPTRFGG